MEVTIMNKKTIASLVAGVIILGGAATPFIAQAAEQANSCLAVPGHHQIDPEKFAQEISDTYGTNKDEILKYQKSGVNFKDLSKASFLAKASDKSLQEVLAAKTPTNTWKDVAKSLGVTREQVRALRHEMAATQLETKLRIPKQASQDLMNQGYRPQDIAIANELAKNTSKEIPDILSLRKINNTWHDVAQTLGVDENTFIQDMKDISVAFPHRGFHQNHGNNQNDK
jgi:hypothetical protein